MSAPAVATPLAVLIVEDSRDDYELIRAALRGVGMPVDDRLADTPEDLRAALQVRAWDIVISDHRLPRMTSADTLRMVRAHDPLLPFVIVSGEMDARAAVAAMQAGADDYVMKDHLGGLGPAIARALEAARLRRREQQAAQALSRSEDRFRSLAEHLPGIVLQFQWDDDALSFTYVSDGAVRMLGLDPATLQQEPQRWFAAMPPEDADALKRALRVASRKMRNLRWTGRMQRVTGRTVWVDIAASQRQVAPGGVVWDAIVSDITAQKEAEAALVQSREELRKLTAHLAVIREQERERIARELHDEVGSTLTALKIELALLRNGLKSQETHLAGLQRAEQLVESAILTSTRIMHDLRPSILDEGLVPALEWQARSFEQRMRLACDFHSSHEEIPLSGEQSITLFRICQEALNNVAKHAQAHAVNVDLRAGAGRVALEITDDGRGITSADLARSDRFGLRGMRERVQALGGTIRIGAREGGGSTVAVELPLASAQTRLIVAAGGR